MRHPFQNAAPQAPDAAGPREPGTLTTTTRRLRIALGTWVAIEATRAGRRGAPDPATTTTRTEPGAASTANRAPDTASATANVRASTTELDAIEAAYLAINKVDSRMHPTRPGSDLALINSTVPGTPTEVHPHTWRLLQFARRIYDLTDGVFDPCVPTRPGRLGDVEIKPDTPTLISHAPVQLDLGGIAKGYAIDQAIEALIEHGCTSGLVNAGGDVRVFGDRTETILLRRRAQGGAEDIYRPVVLNNAALAVSDLDATERPQEHQGYYNRFGTTQRRYAAVLARDATTADALTKCVLLCPAATTERVLRELAAQTIEAG